MPKCLQEVDAHFLARLRARELPAIGELIDNQGAAVYQVVSLLEKDPSKAYNIMVTTFTIALNLMESYYPGQGSLFRWLLQIAIPQIEAEPKEIIEKLNVLIQSHL
ncbi:hypothetical protein [Pseudoflavitalea rhizosphaerae]|uniref:hypothetical protein n=1 Tax=Pseudoflavitalea rhizosphaerae TaxID=1884793 RepID=UPI000F8C9659|nr:hypothetical protein [Pseudoflavitalea rhizosphaerae]